MVDFIRWLFKGSNEFNVECIYLGKDKKDGDNSDNGNHIFDLEIDQWIVLPTKEAK